MMSELSQNVITVDGRVFVAVEDGPVAAEDDPLNGNCFDPIAVPEVVKNEFLSEGESETNYPGKDSEFHNSTEDTAGEIKTEEVDSTSEDDLSACEWVSYFRNISGPTVTDVINIKKEDISDAEISGMSIDSYSDTGATDFEYDESLDQNLTQYEEVDRNCVNDSDSDFFSFSSHRSESVWSSISTDACYLDQRQCETYYDSSRIKLVNVSVVLEDLFQKISRNGSCKPVQRHINSKSCLCIFCTGKFKLRSKENDSVKIFINKNNEDSSFHSDNYSGEPVVEQWNSCTVCPAQFKFMHSLTRHSVGDHGVHLCTECPRKFQHRSDLQTHFKLHPVSKPYFCVFCSFKSKVEAELKIHARVHSTEQLFSCAECLVAFDKSQSLQDHLQKHIVEGSFLCLHCGAKFMSTADLDSHLAVHLDKSITSEVEVCEKSCLTKEAHSLFSAVQSTDCTATFKTTNELRRHSVLHLKNRQFSHQRSVIKGGRFSCKLCPATFKLKIRLEKHLVVHSATKPFSCSKCSAKFKRNADLKCHSAVHLRERPFSCGVCNAEFKTNKVHRQHLIVHSAEKPFCCPLCPAEFKRNSEVISHLRTHGTNSRLLPRTSLADRDALSRRTERLRDLAIHSNEDTYSCPHCAASFKSKTSQIQHLAVHSAGKSLSCEICPTKFKSKSECEQHPPVQSSEELAGPYCSAKIKRKVKVEAHLTVDDSSKQQFLCENCNASFRTVKGLARHSAVHSKEVMLTDGHSLTPAELMVNLNQNSVADSKEKTLSNGDIFNRVKPHKMHQCLAVSSSIQTFPCHKCDDSFKSRSGLWQHHTWFHSNDKVHSCKHCAASFKSNADLIRHLVVHSSERRYACSICPAKFKTKEVWARHSVVHTKEKPFSCPQCVAKFKNKLSLKRHLAHHDSIKKRFLCADCNAAFKTKHVLTQHLGIHLKERMSRNAYPSTTATRLRSEGSLIQPPAAASGNQPFSCHECGATFKLRSQLQKHLIFHLNKKTYSCKNCGALFKYKANLIRHLVVHSSERPYACSICPAKFKSKEVWERHFVVHTSEKRFSCPQCIKTFKRRDGLKAHLAHHDADKERFSRTDFNAAFKTKRMLMQHLAIQLKERMSRKVYPSTNATPVRSKGSLIQPLAAASGNQPFSCHECGATFKFRSQLQKHLIVHSNKRAFRCKLCTASFKLKGSLVRHLAVHSSERPYACSICPAKFKTKEVWKRHFVVHSSNKPHACGKCSVKFKTEGELKLHLVVHSSWKPFCCRKCGTSFKRKTELKNHLAVHDSNTEPFSCAYCSAIFKSKYVLTRHLATHSKLGTLADTDLPTTSKRVHSCEHCVASFKSKANLIRHSVVHSSDRPYKCGVCHKRFKTKLVLRRHLAIHADKKKFSCSQCNATFKFRYQLKQHLVVHSSAQ